MVYVGRVGKRLFQKAAVKMESPVVLRTFSGLLYQLFALYRKYAGEHITAKFQVQCVARYICAMLT